MVWAVQSVAEFERWFLTLESAIRGEIAAKISLLQQVGLRSAGRMPIR
jgi:hypothetical protein